ncbi:hypothetical protein CEXT_219691 [Caerostris extrusa]|uniref:Uncharacterized protein n=1 Tax=Caerostris extrusa TaxID=172846 RepID=A0AAV4QS51_CAEEX|nr:hypothetical protein CEXT_219691 [Caerostris extrusa]
MDNFLNLPVFISVFHILASLFWYGYSFAFPPNVENATQIYVSLGFVQYFRVADDHFNTSCSYQPSSGDGEGICSVFASVVSKAVQHHKTSRAPEIYAQNCFNIVENLSNRQIVAHQFYRLTYFVWNSAWHSRERPEFN